MPPSAEWAAPAAADVDHELALGADADAGIDLTLDPVPPTDDGLAFSLDLGPTKGATPESSPFGEPEAEPTTAIAPAAPADLGAPALSTSASGTGTAPGPDGDPEDAASTARPPASAPVDMPPRWAALMPSAEPEPEPESSPTEAAPSAPTAAPDTATQPAAAPIRPARAEAPDEPDTDRGPETLASLLPEPVGEWPPRGGRSKPSRRDKKRREAAVLAAAGSAQPGQATGDIAPAADAKPPHPRFVREAHRQAFWQHPATRGGLGLGVLLLSATAAAQLAWPMRDTLAARWPASAPALAWACAHAGCSIEAPRALAPLSLDGSSLTRTETEHVLLFSADLHNHAEHAVRMPAFDLRFTDLSGQVVARKVFDPAQLGLPQKALAAESEVHLRARLQIDGLDVAGFQAEIFYP